VTALATVPAPTRTVPAPQPRVRWIGRDTVLVEDIVNDLSADDRARLERMLQQVLATGSVDDKYLDDGEPAGEPDRDQLVFYGRLFLAAVQNAGGFLPAVLVQAPRAVLA
jgi:hypothetical protein